MSKSNIFYMLVFFTLYFRFYSTHWMMCRTDKLVENGWWCSVWHGQEAGLKTYPTYFPALLPCTAAESATIFKSRIGAWWHQGSLLWGTSKEPTNCWYFVHAIQMSILFHGWFYQVHFLILTALGCMNLGLTVFLDLPPPTTTLNPTK